MKKILFLLIFSVIAQASFENIKARLDRGRISFSNYPVIINNLISNGHYYSAIPWAKEYLANSGTKIDRNFDIALEKLLTIVGINQFETMPIEFLDRSNANNAKYTIAKKYFRKEDYDRSIYQLKKINVDSNIYPFSLNMLGTIYSLKNDQNSAISYFEDCVSFTKKEINRNKGRVKRQLSANMDYCTLGLARANYAKKNYEKSELLYLDIPKSSGVWPHIVYEEAWNSYYQGNFNRTLGKLVTYKAPLFRGFYNPEIDVLNALTYYRMCLFDDANKIAEDFYKEYLNSANSLRNFLLKRGKDYMYYYKLMARLEDGSERSSSLLVKLLHVIEKEEAYQEIKGHLLAVSDEFRSIRSQRDSRTRRILLRNSAEVLKTQKRLLGSYVRGRLVGLYADVYKAFQNMSFIKLEILAKQKEKLYSMEEKTSEKRGDVKYLERNEKQYFWNFNGEFWADELGDYVFALKNQC